jgi:hypothetical protein
MQSSPDTTVSITVTNRVQLAATELLLSAMGNVWRDLGVDTRLLLLRWLGMPRHIRVGSGMADKQLLSVSEQSMGLLLLRARRRQSTRRSSVGNDPVVQTEMSQSQ